MGKNRGENITTDDDMYRTLRQINAELKKLKYDTDKIRAIWMWDKTVFGRRVYALGIRDRRRLPPANEDCRSAMARNNATSYPVSGWCGKKETLRTMCNIHNFLKMLDSDYIP